MNRGVKRLNNDKSLASVDAVLRSAASQLATLCTSPLLDAQLLLAQVTGKSRAQLLAAADDELSRDDLSAFQQLLARRLRAEPLAYILGTQEFWSLPLHVNAAVLIPRPETELVVERALVHLQDRQRPRVLDLGTGSGAIALAIAKERPDAVLLATDLSAQALAVARDNALRLQLRNIEFRQCDWYTSMEGQRFDLIVSNPPYIARDDPHLEAAVLNHEPSAALLAGTDGLVALATIVSGAMDHLRTASWLVVEHGWRQRADLQTLLELHSFAHVRCHPDLAGLDRVSEGKR